jgi:multicomponent Na+:H+ antiporter subunit D
MGAALLYARTGALNMAQIGLALSGHHSDPLVIVAMVLLLGGFLTKAAVVPMHFWTADAEAVAPIPVCALFSGVMVALGIYAVARLYWVIFSAPMAGHEAAVRAIFVAFGAITALVGAAMCVMQRHVKRLLAFSTISHVGLFLCGVALLSTKGLTATAVYIVGHGLTKAALFMCVGVLAHRFATIDEYQLHGRGRQLPILGVLMVVGALLLGGIPPFTTFQGKSLLEDAAMEQPGYGWLVAVFIIASGLTGGAVLRVCGRVFLGWGAEHGPHPELETAARETIDEERDPRDHTPPIMIIVPGVLLLGALVLGLLPGAVHGVTRLAAQFITRRDYSAWVLHGQHLALPGVPDSSPSAVDYVFGGISTLGTVLIAALGLWGYRLTTLRYSWPARRVGVGFEFLRDLHSGHIGDYVAWWGLGVAVMGGVCLIGLR